MSERHQLQSIQFLRFIAASAVVFDHAQRISNDNWAEHPASSLAYFFDFGVVGIHIFFVISGLVMVLTTKASPADFLLRRVARIYPIYWVYAAIYLFVGQITGHVWPNSIAKSLLLWPGDSSIIACAWTLTYEMYFYICFSMALMLPRGLLVLTGFFLVSVAARKWFPIDPVTSPLLLEFIAGAWLAKLYQSNYRPSGLVYSSIVVTAIAGYLASFAIGYERFSAVAMLGIPSVALVASLLFRERQLPSLVFKLSFLGDSSYSLYLTHMLVLAISFGVIRPHIDLSGFSAVLIWIGLYPLCVAIGLLGYHYAERPITVLCSQILRPRRHPIKSPI